jgi:hypothetical protein
MKKVLTILNVLLYLAFCSLAASGLALEFRLDNASQTLLGLTKRNWATAHALIALTFVTFALVHVWMNRAWFRATFAKMRWSTLIFVALGLMLVIVTTLAPVE